MENNIIRTDNKIKDASLYDCLVLAFVGDGVHSLFVRSKLAMSSTAKAGGLHLLASKVVKAAAQSEALDFIVGELTEEEKDIARRARNTKTNNIAKHSCLEEYKKSTAFECLIGWWFLKGEEERLNSILERTYLFIQNRDKEAVTSLQIKENKK